jgi:hypothetical protein
MQCVQRGRCYGRRVVEIPNHPSVVGRHRALSKKCKVPPKGLSVDRIGKATDPEWCQTRIEYVFQNIRHTFDRFCLLHAAAFACSVSPSPTIIIEDLVNGLYLPLLHRPCLIDPRSWFLSTP